MSNSIIKFVFLLLPSACGSQGLNISTGTHLVLNGNITLVVNNGGFKNDGLLDDAAGSISFTGNAATSQSFISGTGSGSFYKLIMNKTSNGIKLNANISMSGILDLQNGDSIFLNGNQILLGSAATITGETNTRRITGLTGGYIEMTVNLNEPTNVNPGNIGIAFSSAANLGSTLIRRGHQQQGAASVYRYFDISPANNTALNASLDFYYFHNELAGNTEGNLSFYSSTTSGATWVKQGENGINSSQDFVTKTGLNTLNRITLADLTSPLPVTLLYLKGHLENKQVLLDWATATEINSDYFELQRSTDGKNFITLGRITATGNSNSRLYYQYCDASPLTGPGYYRLKQVDINGKFDYSYVIMVITASKTGILSRAYPNPVNNLLQIEFNAETEKDVNLSLYDIKGKLISSKTIHCVTGINKTTWNTSSLPSGLYLLNITGTVQGNLQFLKE